MYKLLPILLFAYGLAITTDDIYENSYALIIGIDKYENVQHLNYAVKDAESIQDILVNTFNFSESNIKLLKNQEATKQNILKSFSDITKKADDKDRVLIYFAGHGATDDLPEGGEMGYLLPVDGDNDDLFLSSIAMDDLKRISLMSKAKHLLYLVDACYGGIAAIGSRGLDSKTTPNYIEKITKNKSRQIITAGGRGEEVIEKAEWGHSAFTLNLNRGLKEGNADMDADGYITANELGLFLKKKVTIDSGNQQTPQYGRMTSQEGEFVFVLNSETTNIYKNDNPQQTSNVQPQQRINYNKLAKEMLKQKEGTSATAKTPTTNEILNHLKMNSYFFNKKFGFSMNPINMMMSTYSGTISLFSKNKLNKESALLFYYGSSTFQNDEKLQIDYHRRTFAGRKEWINGKKIKIQDKKGVFTSIGLRYEFRRTETIGGGFETCTEEDYEDLTCSGVSSTGSSQSYWKDGYTKLVNKEYYGFSLGLGARLLFKDIFYWTPAFYFGTHFNAIDEPFFKLEILKFGARIG